MTRQEQRFEKTARAEQIETFLAQAAWGTAARTPLAGDASSRRYERLDHPSRGPAVLMDADATQLESTRAFLRIAQHLRASGLSTPQILAKDLDHGLLLLEDLGDDLFARLTRTDLSLEPTLYAAAIDVLACLHRIPPPGDLPLYGPDRMAPLAALAIEWYAARQDAPASTATPQALSDACHTVLMRAAPETSVMVFRDYHAENLLWLPTRSGQARVGLLDFQDAALGHPGYDVVSLLADARRDVTPETRAAMMRRYIDLTGHAEDSFAAACAALSAQRNLRILGVFARLSLRDAKTGYLGLIPRVWAHLQRDLAHPVCAPLRAVAEAHLPPPTDRWLSDLRKRAGTCQTP
ncbi:MAG: phosphotransferase [Pseudomonadota bacterium]